MLFFWLCGLIIIQIMCGWAKASQILTLQLNLTIGKSVISLPYFRHHQELICILLWQKRETVWNYHFNFQIFYHFLFHFFLIIVFFNTCIINDKTHSQYFIFINLRQQKIHVKRTEKRYVLNTNPFFLENFQFWIVLWSTFSQMGFNLQTPDSSDRPSFLPSTKFHFRTTKRWISSDTLLPFPTVSRDRSWQQCFRFRIKFRGTSQLYSKCYTDEESCWTKQSYSDFPFAWNMFVWWQV